MGWYFILALLIDPAVVDVLRQYEPDVFTLNTTTRVEQEVWNPNLEQVVEKTSDESMHLGISSRAVLSCRKCTQYAFECTPIVHQNTAMRFRFRTTRSDYMRDSSYGLSVQFHNSSMRVYDSGVEVGRVDSVVFSESNVERIIIQNFADHYSIFKGCKQIYRGKTRLPNADAVVIETSAEGGGVDIARIIRNSSFNDLEDNKLK